MAAFCVSRCLWWRTTTLFLAGTTMAALFLVSSGTAYAQIIEVGGTENKEFCKWYYEWDWLPSTARYRFPHVDWRIELGDGIGYDPEEFRSVFVDVRHTSPEGPHGETPNDQIISLSARGLKRPAGRAVLPKVKSGQELHRTHWDTAYMTVIVYGRDFDHVPGHPMATILLRGTHDEDRPCIAKFKHLMSGTLNIATQMLYRDLAGSIVPAQPGTPRLIAPNVIDTEMLPMELIGMPLTGYTLIAQGSGQSKTTLAYPGQVSGQSSQLNFGLANRLFERSQTLDVPFFFKQGQELHIAVDLTQYLGIGAQIQIGQQFIFQNGMCEALPGVLVSHVPISFAANNGFQTNVPYNGPLAVEGCLAGRLTPAITGRITLQAHSTNAVPLTFKARPTQGGEEYNDTITPAPDGSYAINGLPPGNYNIWVKGEKWLAESLPVSMPQIFPDRPAITNLNMTLLPGDTNNDNAVDILDLDALIQGFDTTEGDSHWNGNTDFNGDGATDVLDLDILIQNFDRTGDA